MPSNGASLLVEVNMQKTHYCGGEGMPVYPSKLKVKAVNVFMHDSGMIMTHDYSCPVCRAKHAVITAGIMQPCWSCQSDGYKITKRKTKKWYDIF